MKRRSAVRDQAATRWRSALRLILAITATLPAECLAIRAQDATDPVATASAIIRAGHYDAAIQTAQHGAATRPKDPRLPTIEGIAFSLEGDDTRALACLHQALTIAPDFQRALQAQASILSRRHDPAAIPVLQAILRMTPQDTTAHEMLAVAEAEQGSCVAALEEFKNAGAVVETHADSLQRKAACLLDIRDLSGAAKTFGQVHDLRPTDPGTLYDLAVAQLEANNAQAALQTLSPLLEHTPDIDVLLLAADATEQQGSTPQAAALLRQAIVADPTRSNSYVRFAELCMAHESYQAGIDMVTAGLSRNPHDPALYLARGLLYGGLADYDKAEADFQSAEQSDPHYGTGAFGVGLIEAQRNHPERALETVRAALKAHPDDAQLNFLLARLLLESGAAPGSLPYAQATLSAQKAVRLQPTLLTARDLLAKIDLDTGKPALAAEQCRASLALDPSDSNALYRLMRALRATGDDAGAQAVARQVALQHQQAREQETSRLRYRIEDSAHASDPTKASSNPSQAPEN